MFLILGGMKAWSEHLEPVKIGDLKDGGSFINSCVSEKAAFLIW